MHQYDNIIAELLPTAILYYKGVKDTRRTSRLSIEAKI